MTVTHKQEATALVKEALDFAEAQSPEPADEQFLASLHMAALGVTQLGRIADALQGMECR